MAICHSFCLEQLCMGLITANFNTHNILWKLLTFPFSDLRDEDFHICFFKPMVIYVETIQSKDKKNTQNTKTHTLQNT